MTSSIETRSAAPSRRALLAGALGGIGALAASAIGRPRLALATDPNDVVLGGDNTASTTTKITNNANINAVFASFSTTGLALWGSSGSNKGVYGFSSSSIGVHGYSNSYFGVLGTSGSAAGVAGNSTGGIGVAGSSSSNIGVQGYSTASNHPATLGWSALTGTGVQGASGGSLPAAKAKTGVFGYAAHDNFSRGVIGESPAGIGVYGISSSGYGGYFAGKVYTTKWYEMTEISIPAAALSSRARLFVRDNGSGLTQLCVRFHTGAVKVLATQP